jgi:hypothetical protein
MGTCGNVDTDREGRRPAVLTSQTYPKVLCLDCPQYLDVAVLVGIVEYPINSGGPTRYTTFACAVA